MFILSRLNTTLPFYLKFYTYFCGKIDRRSPQKYVQNLGGAKEI